MFTRQQQSDLERAKACWDEGREAVFPGADREVCFEFPLGELAHDGPDRVGLAMLVQRLEVTPVAIEPSDRFKAQGLEGKLSLRVTYETALLFAMKLEPYRFQIRECLRPVRVADAEA